MKKFIITLLIITAQLHAQETWNLVPLGTTDNLVDICFVNDQDGWIIGNSGALIKTTNGGAYWNVTAIPYTGLNAVQFVDEGTGWIVGDNGLILKSTNGGTSWITQTGGQNYYLDDLVFFDSQVGIICGGLSTYEGRMIRTTDSGNSWNEISLPNPPIWSSPTPRLKSIFFINDTLGWAEGLETAIIRTINGGMNWEQVAYSSYLYHYSICFLDESIGLECGYKNAGTGNYNGPIYKTTDGGSNWTHKYSVGYGSLNSISYCSNSNSIYAVGSGGQYQSVGKIIKSTDEGESWFEIQSPTTERLNKITFNVDKGWIVGENGILLKATIPLGVFDTKPVSDFYLSQNYPNPFNPSTKIKYQIPDVSFVTIKVYDILGNEITTLVNEEKPAGSYEVDFSATAGRINLISGIYFYQIKAGSFSEIKKMILLK